MVIRFGCFIFRSLAALTFAATAFGQLTTGNIMNPPEVPANIAVPAGHTVFLKGHAEGTQNYICLPTASGVGWTFFSPQATLFFSVKFFGTELSQQIITHFLSPNPAENGTPRATWQSSLDTSAVWGRAVQSSTDPQFVASGAIPWLLLQVVGTRRGPLGGDILTNATYIQRLTTSGGTAPGSGCTQQTDVGATSLVPYTADYYFFKASASR